MPMTIASSASTACAAVAITGWLLIINVVPADTRTAAIAASVGPWSKWTRPAALLETSSQLHQRGPRGAERTSRRTGVNEPERAELEDRLGQEGGEDEERCDGGSCMPADPVQRPPR